jgi:hypothetical protein
MRAELQVARFAAVRHQVVTATELRKLGVSNSTRKRWVAVGRLRSEHRGVFVYGGGPLSLAGRFYAALCAIGPDAVLSHISAAIHHGIWPVGEPDVIQVTVPRQVRSRDGVRVHCVERLPKQSVTIWKGIRVTTPARTAFDLAATVPEAKKVRRAVHEAQVHRILAIGDLEAELKRLPANHRGRPRIKAEIAAGRTATRSGLEDWGAAFLRRNGFPPFETNAHPPNLPAWVEVDILFRAQRLAVELDSNKYHRTAWRRQKDAKKRRLVRTSGTEVLVLTDADSEPVNEAATVAKVWAALRDAERAAA